MWESEITEHLGCAVSADISFGSSVSSGSFAVFFGVLSAASGTDFFHSLYSKKRMGIERALFCLRLLADVVSSASGISVVGRTSGSFCCGFQSILLQVLCSLHKSHMGH